MAKLSVKFITLISVNFILLFMIIDNALCKGIYVDNGVDQTMIDVLTQKEKNELTSRLSHVFNLPGKKSKRRFSNESIAFNSETSAVSRWIRAVYDLEKKSDNDFSDDEIRRIKRSDLVMTFSPQNRQRNELWFDLDETSIPKVDQVIHAELHVRSKHATVVSLYEFDWNDKVFWRLVDSVQVGHGGWIKLNATKIIDRWVNNREKIQALKIDSTEVDLSEAFVAAFFSRSNVLKPKRTKNKPGFSYVDPNPLKRSTKRKDRPCQLYKMYVRFQDLNLEQDIIAPEGYEAGFCEGQCRFPLSVQSEPTPHAIIQTLFAFQNPEIVPEPNCSPREYDELNVIYSDSDGNYRMHRYANMLVRNCRCG